jgi:alkylation response protein AidB-like acyl-CoA dehydrogenase
VPATDAAQVLANVASVAADFAAARKDRQVRRELHREDFDALAAAGFLYTGVPLAQGGLWDGVASSTRTTAEILRALARGDPSVALVSSMHPAVLSFWHATSDVPAEFASAWRAQSELVAQHAADGHWWGTITSEPGSGGDVSRTKTAARPDGAGGFGLHGQKHFGSGSGITSFMITTAVAEGEEKPDWFYIDVRDSPWDGSTGIKLIAPWDGHGMTATQSHGFAFDGAKSERMAWTGNLDAIAFNAAPFVGSIFTAVVLGIVDEAIATARAEIAPRASELRAYEQVEWVHAETEAWSAVQIYEGMLRAVETEAIPHRHVLMGKNAVAELAESVLKRLSRIIGGGSFARRAPYGFWFEDVRALGFLRPPWPLSFDTLALTAWG